MKKRYLSMLMAVVMCFGLFVTGALAAEDTTEIPVEVTETPTEDAAETPTEAATESPAATETPAASDVPQSLSLGNDGEGEDNTSSSSPVVSPADSSQSNPSSPQPSSVTLSFPISQTVNVKTMGAESRVGTNTFNYKLVLEHWDENATMAVENTTDGVTWTLGDGVKQASADGDTHALTVYDLSLAMTGTGTATANVSITTAGPAVVYVFQVGTPDANWEYEYKMYDAYMTTMRDGDTDPTAAYDEASNYAIYLWYNTPLDETQWPKGEPNYGYNGNRQYYGLDDRWYQTDSTSGALNTPAAFTNTYTGPAWVYEGFDLIAWTAKTLTWDSENEDYDFTEELLSGVKFGVFSSEDCTEKDLVKEFTTGENGNVTVMLDEQYLPSSTAEDYNTKTFYLKQTGTTTTEHGDRPMAEEVWAFTAKATYDDEANKVTVKLLLPEGDNGGIGQQETDEGKYEFWVYNQRYSTITFDVEQEVAVKNAGMEPGENTFELLVAITVDPSVTTAPALHYTPEGGEKTELSPYKKRTYHKSGDSAAITRRVYCYKLPLTVDGTGVAKATITIGGWEDDLAIWYINVYQKNDAPADWEYASYMYALQLPYLQLPNDYVMNLLYDDVPLTVHRYDAAADGWKGEDGRRYASQDTAAQSVHFVNTYIKAAPTAKPAQAPKTGDEANVTLWLALATVSMMGLAVVMRKKAK